MTTVNIRIEELAQQLARWMQNEELLRSGKVDGTKISNAVERYAAQYDLFYDAINDFLTAHGYQPIGFIKGITLPNIPAYSRQSFFTFTHS